MNQSAVNQDTTNVVWKDWKPFYSRGAVIFIPKRKGEYSFTVTKEQAEEALARDDLSIRQSQLYTEVVRLCAQMEKPFDESDGLKRLQKVTPIREGQWQKEVG